jgi:ribose 5-phosphate isomerase
MFILQIEHPVPDFSGWKRAFDSDPLNRKESGVKGYRIFRVTDNENQVVIELEFDDINKAKEMHEALKKIWSRVQGSIINNPQSKILEAIESIQY